MHDLKSSGFGKGDARLFRSEEWAFGKEEEEGGLDLPEAESASGSKWL